MGTNVNSLPEHVQIQVKEYLKDAFPVNNKKKRNKYGSTRTNVDGIWFDSKHESEIYMKLKDMKRCGEVVWFARQCRFVLTGGIEYVADFIVTIYGTRDYITEIWDAKSEPTKTATYKLKKKLMEADYGIIIKEV